MSFLTTPLAFVFVLGIIIFVHEFGHLITAKAFGMRVFVFSFGFGKRLFGFKWGETDCRVSAVPLGGYVKLEGEPGDHLSEDTSMLGDGKDFLSRPRWQRFLVYLAGPVMNAVLTIAVAAGLNMIGFMVDGSPYDKPVIGAVDAGSSAERAGLAPGDTIVAIDGRPVPTWEDAAYGIALRPGQDLKLRVRRGSEERELAVRSETQDAQGMGSIGVHPLVRIGQVLPGTPAEAAGFEPEDAILSIDGKPIKEFSDVLPAVSSSGGRTLVFRIWRSGQEKDVAVAPRDDGQGFKVGIGPWYIVKKFGPVDAVGQAFAWSWKQVTLTFEVIGRLITAQISPKTMMGPLGIAQASGDAARGGALPLLYLVAVISLQVGLLNLFPLAPLDGGHLAILALEGAARRDLSPTIKGWIMNAGAMVIFLLIGLVLYSDVSKMDFVRRLLQ